MCTSLDSQNDRSYHTSKDRATAESKRPPFTGDRSGVMVNSDRPSIGLAMDSIERALDDLYSQTDRIIDLLQPVMNPNNMEGSKTVDRSDSDLARSPMTLRLYDYAMKIHSIRERLYDMEQQLEL